MLASLNQLAAFISATIIGNWISLPADVAPQLHCGSCDCAVTCPSEGPISLQLVEIVRGQLERCGPTTMSCPAVPACPEVPAPQPCPSQAITAVLCSVLGLLVGLALGRASSPRRVAPPAADKAVAAGGQLRLQEASSSSTSSSLEASSSSSSAPLVQPAVETAAPPPSAAPGSITPSSKRKSHSTI